MITDKPADRALTVVLDAGAELPTTVVFRDPSGREVGRVINLELPKRQEEIDAAELRRRLIAVDPSPGAPLDMVVGDMLGVLVKWAEELGHDRVVSPASLTVKAAELDRGGFTSSARILRAIAWAADIPASLPHPDGVLKP